MTNLEIKKEIDLSFDYLSQFYKQKLIAIPMGGLNHSTIIQRNILIKKSNFFYECVIKRYIK